MLLNLTTNLLQLDRYACLGGEYKYAQTCIATIVIICVFVVFIVLIR